MRKHEQRKRVPYAKLDLEEIVKDNIGKGGSPIWSSKLRAQPLDGVHKIYKKDETIFTKRNNIYNFKIVSPHIFLRKNR